jgi:hypothetical protein
MHECIEKENIVRPRRNPARRIQLVLLGGGRVAAFHSRRSIGREAAEAPPPGLPRPQSGSNRRPAAALAPTPTSSVRHARTVGRRGEQGDGKNRKKSPKCEERLRNDQCDSSTVQEPYQRKCRGRGGRRSFRYRSGVVSPNPSAAALLDPGAPQVDIRPGSRPLSTCKAHAPRRQASGGTDKTTMNRNSRTAERTKMEDAGSRSVLPRAGVRNGTERREPERRF